MSDKDKKIDLYELLPVLYRLRDAERGYPLRALLEIVSGQADIIKQNIDTLWDEYQCRAVFWKRFLRSLIPSIIFLCLMIMLFISTPERSAMPIRSPADPQLLEVVRWVFFLSCPAGSRTRGYGRITRVVVGRLL